MKIRTICIIACLLIHSSVFAQTESFEHIVGTSYTLNSSVMQDEREIQVYLPDSYESSNQEYPVIYLLDGQRYFLHGVSVLKSFVEFKETPECIIVGISKNTSDRNQNFSSNSDNYLRFIKKEVIDLVENKFRTSDKRILFGWAYGGGFTIEVMAKESNLFDVYIAASPFPVKSKINLLDSLFADDPKFNKVLFFTSGSNEGQVKSETSELNAYLKSNTIESFNWTFRELQGEEHRSTPFITLYHGIKSAFKYYPELQFSDLEEFLKFGGLDSVYKYYEERARRYGFSSKLSDWTMFSITRNAMRAENYKKFNALMEEFSNTKFLERIRISRSMSIGEFYFQNRHYQKAIEIFKILEENLADKRPLDVLTKIYFEIGNEDEAQKYLDKIDSLNINDSN